MAVKGWFAGVWWMISDEKLLHPDSTKFSPSRSSAPTSPPLQPFYNRSTELDPDYTLTTILAFCI
jgi:hypothetical protein